MISCLFIDNTLPNLFKLVTLLTYLFILFFEACLLKLFTTVASKGWRYFVHPPGIVELVMLWVSFISFSFFFNFLISEITPIAVP